MLVGSQLIDSNLKNPFFILLRKLFSDQIFYEEKIDKFLSEISKQKIDTFQIKINTTKSNIDIEGKNTLTPTIRQATKVSESQTICDFELREFDENISNMQLLIKSNQEFVEHLALHQAKFKKEFNDKEIIVEFHGKVIRLYDYNVIIWSILT